MTEQTVATLIQAVSAEFAQHPLSYGHGTDNAWDEAVSLVLYLTKLPDVEASLALVLTQSQVDVCLQATEQRITTRQPLAYILGRCRYMGLEFKLQAGVVVPRSPIGYLLHDGLEPWMPSEVNQVLDLCSGSGCLGILAANVFPTAHVTLLELDDQAIRVAEENVSLHKMNERITLIQADVTNPRVFNQSFDLILSNPPYVDAPDMASLPAEYRAEPARGLAAGEDGLLVMDAILENLPKWLADGGLFVGEVGASAAALVRKYPRLPFIWPELNQGGEGVFALEAAALTSHTAATK